MCRALKVLCAARGPEALAALKRASVGVLWELSGGATSASELLEQVDQLVPDVVVVDARLGSKAVSTLRRAVPGVRVVTIEPAPGGSDQMFSSELIRSAVLETPPPGGPVRR